MSETETSRRVVAGAALGAAGLALLYVSAQLAEWLGFLGSGGGPEGVSTPPGLVVLLLPSLLLAPVFVVLMAGLHTLAPVDRRALSLAAFGFAVMYGTLVGLVYFVQLTLVAPRMAAGDMQDIEFLRFVPYRSFLFAIDLLGYSLMSLSTLCAAFALPDRRGRRRVKLFLLANGLLLPFLAFQMLAPQLIWGGALWSLTFPLAMLSIAAMFRRGASTPSTGA